MLEDLHLRYVDLLPAFAEARDRDLYAQDYHLWVDGHAILARSILDAVVDLLAR